MDYVFRFRDIVYFCECVDVNEVRRIFQMDIGKNIPDSILQIEIFQMDIPDSIFAGGIFQMEIFQMEFSDFLYRLISLMLHRSKALTL